METLLDDIFDAHGGLDTWMKYRSVSAHLHQAGVLWGLKGKASLLDETAVTVSTTRQWASHSPFGDATRRSSYEKDRIALISSADDTVQAENDAPRSMFQGHTLQTPWDDLQLAFFAGCAMWTYLNVPFLLQWPGVKVVEEKPWNERGEMWRRFAVTYPDNLEVFSKHQKVYFGDDNLLRRMDYDVEIAGNTPGAHYVSEYQNFDGILFPTKRAIFPRQPDGQSLTEPLVVSIALEDIRLSAD